MANLPSLIQEEIVGIPQYGKVMAQRFLMDIGFFKGPHTF